MVETILIGGCILAGLMGMYEKKGDTVVRRGRGMFGTKYKTVEGKCFRCNGTGKVHGKTCRKCGGNGRFAQKTWYL